MGWGGILASLESDQITFFDDLFCELFLNKYRTQVKKNVIFITNIIKDKNLNEEGICPKESISFWTLEKQTPTDS